MSMSHYLSFVFKIKHHNDQGMCRKRVFPSLKKKKKSILTLKVDKLKFASSINKGEFRWFVLRNKPSKTQINFVFFYKKSIRTQWDGLLLEINEANQKSIRTKLKSSDAQTWINFLIVQVEQTMAADMFHHPSIHLNQCIAFVSALFSTRRNG